MKKITKMYKTIVFLQDTCRLVAVVRLSIGQFGWMGGAPVSMGGLVVE
jgi:hypothetical protein